MIAFFALTGVALVVFVLFLAYQFFAGIVSRQQGDSSNIAWLSGRISVLERDVGHLDDQLRKAAK